MLMARADNSNELLSEKQSMLLGVLISIAIVALCIVGIWAIVTNAGPAVLSFFSSLSTLDSAVIVALITASVSIASYVFGGIANNRMKHKEYLRSHREEPYMQLVSLFYDVEVQSKKHEPMSQEEMVNQVNAFNKALTLWGSAKAIKTWGNWKANSARGNVDPQELLFEMEKVLIQLRKDMGLKRGLKQGDLLRLNLSDIDDVIEEKKKLAGKK